MDESKVGGYQPDDEEMTAAAGHLNPRERHDLTERERQNSEVYGRLDWSEKGFGFVKGSVPDLVTAQHEGVTDVDFAPVALENGIEYSIREGNFSKRFKKEKMQPTNHGDNSEANVVTDFYIFNLPDGNTFYIKEEKEGDDRNTYQIDWLPSELFDDDIREVK